MESYHVVYFEAVRPDNILLYNVCMSAAAVENIRFKISARYYISLARIFVRHESLLGLFKFAEYFLMFCLAVENSILVALSKQKNCLEPFS